MEHSDCVVAIQVLCYNEKDYITQCLDSIVMQRTTFPFVAVVHDDASTDGTADMVRDYAARYPDRILPVLQTQNQYSQGHSPAHIVSEYMQRLHPKYNCFLDGDDYWTDDQLLQTEYEYLESHPETTMVYSKYMLLMPDGEIRETDPGYRWEVPTFDSLLFRNNIPFNTVMFKHDFARQYVDDIRPFDKPWPVGDWSMWLYLLATKHIVAYIPKTTAVYRITETSITRKKTLWERLIYLYRLMRIPLYFVRYSTQPHIRWQIKRRFYKSMLVEIIDRIKDESN